MTRMDIGYARISTAEQNLGLRLQAPRVACRRKGFRNRRTWCVLVGRRGMRRIVRLPPAEEAQENGTARSGRL